MTAEKKCCGVHRKDVKVLSILNPRSGLIDQSSINFPVPILLVILVGIISKPVPNEIKQKLMKRSKFDFIKCL